MVINFKAAFGVVASEGTGVGRLRLPRAPMQWQYIDYFDGLDF